MTDPTARPGHSPAAQKLPRTVAPLRRGRRDFLAVGAIAAVVVAGVGTVYATAPVRQAHLSPAETTLSAPQPPTAFPAALSPAWEQSTTSLSGAAASASPLPPVEVGGIIVVAAGGHVAGVDPVTGEALWTYRREVPVCSLSAAFGHAVATFKTGVGCGDVVSIDAATGQYTATRSSRSPESVAPISSNDAVGTVAPSRLELWRKDLVRTVEYGEVEAKQEPDFQPHEQCSIAAALTRSDLVTVVEDCPGVDKSQVRLMERKPKDARKPELKKEFSAPGPHSVVVAQGQHGAVVFTPDKPGSGPVFTAFAEDSDQVTTTAAASSPWVDDFVARSGRDASADAGVFTPMKQDLANYLSWFDGARWILFTPASLRVDFTFDDAIGTGIQMGKQLIYPTAEGYAVVDSESRQRQRTVPLDRGGYSGAVQLKLVGGTFVEVRGDTVVALSPAGGGF